MYQWVNAQSGRTQMSGKPPAWYRSDRPGPRVFVFENGRLVDDTAKSVSLEDRASLRSRAFAISAQEAEAARQAAAEKQLGADGKRVATAEQDSVTGNEKKSALERGFGDTEATPSEAKPQEAPDATIARLKSIINAWEDQQTAEARRLLEEREVVPGTTSPSP
jgi:Tfp pilus assembly protein PilX